MLEPCPSWLIKAAQVGLMEQLIPGMSPASPSGPRPHLHGCLITSHHCSALSGMWRGPHSRMCNPEDTRYPSGRSDKHQGPTSVAHLSDEALLSQLMMRLGGLPIGRGCGLFCPPAQKSTKGHQRHDSASYAKDSQQEAQRRCGRKIQRELYKGKRQSLGDCWGKLHELQ